jgi:tRNA pseudouridine55 synthase
MQPFSGILLIDKPAGITSFGVVARVRRILSQAAGKKVKVGHTGTLDPFATGLMIVVVGEYCKRAAEFSKLDKSYEATLRLGYTSTTGDPEGDLEAVSSRQPIAQEIQVALATFRGVIQQTPPAFSAIKIDGQRAYKLARAGKEVVMPVRTVTVQALELRDYSYPDVAVLCSVSSGTYIRSLAEDIGKQLSVGAYVTALRRTRVGEYSIDQAMGLEEVSAAALREVAPTP